MEVPVSAPASKPEPAPSSTPQVKLAVYYDERQTMTSDQICEWFVSLFVAGMAGIAIFSFSTFGRGIVCAVAIGLLYRGLLALGNRL